MLAGMPYDISLLQLVRMCGTPGTAQDLVDRCVAAPQGQIVPDLAFRAALPVAVKDLADHGWISAVGVPPTYSATPQDIADAAADAMIPALTVRLQRRPPSDPLPAAILIHPAAA
jgi:hypothetical protein